MAGILALGVAACGDDVEIVQPTPEPPPPPPPVTATMAPASASVAVGNSVVFAVNASGGVAGEAASWTCASSNTGIATVTSTSAGCSATGVAAGDVTITASVTKSGETVNVGAQLTVTSDEEPPAPPGDPAFVLVAGIAGEDDTDASGLKKRVSVTVGVERGDQDLEELSLLVDGEVVESQSFGGGMDMMGMTPPDEAAEQAPYNFTLSFDSHDYDRESGAPTYMNGEHTISAELEIGIDMADGTHGHETVSSNAVTVEFANDDFIAASYGGLGDGAMNEETGQIWYGGPDAAVEITALPVLYSSGAVSSLTLLQFCGDDAATDSEAPFSFSLDCDETTDKDGDGDKPKFTVEGDEIDVVAKAVYLDFDGPPAPHFNRNPNGREDGWVNPTVDFLGKYHKDRNKNGWLKYNEDEEGVGGYAPQLRYSSTTPSIVDGARGATANVLPTEPTKVDAVCVIATAVDLLGNESSLPSAGSDCVKAANYVEDEDGDYPAGIRAGLDVSAPTIGFSPASPRANASSLKEFQVEVADSGGSTGKSGLHSEPVLAKIELRDADNDIICGDDDDAGGAAGEEKINGDCVLAGGLDFNDPLATTDGLNDASGAGYYTFTAMSQDKAGNMSEQLVRTAVNDGKAPELGLIVGGYSKGSWSLTATLTDNLSIKEYWAEAVDVITDVGDQTDGIVILPREGSVSVDAYNSAELTQNLLTTPPLTMQVFRALQPANTGETANDPEATATAAATLAEIKVVGVDHGGNNASANSMSLGGAASLARFGLGTARTLTFTTAAAPTTAAERTEQATEAKRWNDNEYDADGSKTRYARDQVFQTFEVEDDESDDDALELRATITGSAGYKKAAAGVVGVAATATAPAVEEKAPTPGVEGLARNPVSRVDFYAAVELKDVSSSNNADRVPPVADGPGATAADNEALVFLGSSSAAGAEDFTHNAGTPDDDSDDYAARKYTWGIDMSGADFVEIAGDEGDYTIVAIAVNSAGVATFATTTEMVEK